eukprot:1147694-Pelagomonas_calceolata.AAC.1
MKAAQRQHADLCKLSNANAVTLHTTLLGVGGTCYTKDTLDQFKQLGFGCQRANKLANFMPILQVMEPGASNYPPDPHQNLLYSSFVMEGIQGSSEPMCLLFLN